MRGFSFALCIIVVQAGAALAAPQIKQPDCSALELWGTHVNAENYNVAPRLGLPKAFEDEEVVPLFGVGVLAWTPEDLQAANQILVKCFGAAGQRHDAAAAGALANANRALQGLVPRVNAALQKAKADSGPLKQQIDGLPDSPELDRGLAALLKVNPAQPDITPFRTLPREIGDPVWRLASQVLPVLANGERETLFKSFGERHAAMQAGFATAADKSIAAATADADGMIQLIAVPQHVGAIEDAATRTRLEQSASDRLKQIGDTLRQAKPAAWVPPSCVELYRWSSGNNATAQVPVGGRNVLSAFLDERVVPVFGLSIAAWSDQDVARFKTLRTLCQGAWQAQAAVPGNTGPNAPELVQLASRGRWIDGADQPIADARTVMASYQRARQALAPALEKISALPDTTASLLPLAQIAVDPMQTMLTPDDRARFAAAINEKRAAIAAHATDAAIKGLADVKLASLGDLKNLFAYAAQTMPTIPDPRGQQAFRDAFNRTMQEATVRLLPEFKAKLDAAPANLASVAEANITLLQLELASPQVAATPAFQTYFQAMQQSRDAMAASARRKNCADFASSVGAGSDADQPLWNGRDSMPLGEFICEIGEHGTVNSYSGAGLLSSTSTLKVTPLKSQMFTISLHKIEVQAGKQMLVGYDIKDAAQASGQAPPGSPNYSVTPNGPVTVEGWEIFIPDIVGMNGAEPDACNQTIDSPAPDSLPIAAKVFWLHCWTLDTVRTHVARLHQGQR